MHENYMPNIPIETHSAGYHWLVKRLADIAQHEDDKAVELSRRGKLDLAGYDGEKVYEPAIDEMAEAIADTYCGYGSRLDEDEIRDAINKACEDSGHNLYLSSDVSLKDDGLKLTRTIARIHEKVASILGNRINPKPESAERLIGATRRRIDKSNIVLLRSSTAAQR
jgi:hypothetical protein